MIKRDIGNYTQKGSKDICRVEASPHTRFYYRIIHPLLGKPYERQHHRQFEERWGISFIILFNLFPLIDKANHPFLWYHLAVDAYALAEIHEVRGGVQCRAVTLRL